MVFILCEGPTEERFVKAIVKREYDFVQPTIIITSPGNKGGSVAYPDFIKQCRNLLRNNTINLLITLFDFARLPKSWYEDENGNIKKCPGEINKRIKRDLGKNGDRIFNVWSIYEFEIIAFIDIDITCEVIGLKYKSQLENVLKNCGHDPEKINDNNYPSKRLEGIYEGYQKILDGISISEKIGKEKICQTKSFKRLFDKLDELKRQISFGS